MRNPLLLTALFAGLAAAQTSAPADAPSSAPLVIRSNTRLVQVNVVAHDKNGVVADLKQEDFVLLDSKKPRKITAFTVETATSTIPGAMPQLPPNVFVNSLQRHQETPTSITVILFDSLNTPITDQVYARKQVAKFLGTLEANDRVALYALTRSDIQILHDFTDDPQSLARAIGRYRDLSAMISDGGALYQRPGSNIIEREAPSAADMKFDEIVNRLTAEIKVMETTTRVRQTTQALEAIPNHLAPLPGRKNLVWISAAFPFSVGLYGPEGLANPVRNSHEIYQDDIARTTRTLNKANMSIYPIDARGLMVTGAYQASLSTMFGTGASLNQVTSWLAQINLAQDTMEDLANLTGGKAYYNTNDIAGAVRKAIEDTKVSYVLGFYADDIELDGKYHELKVQVPGRKGLELRARQGYFASDKAPVPDAALEATMQQAVFAPLQASRIEIGVHVTRLPDAGALQLDLLISPRELTLAPKDDRWQGAIRQSVVQLDAEGKVLDRVTDPIKLNLKKESMTQYMQTGMSFGKTVKAKPGLAQLRVIVVDRDSGVSGSVIIPMSQVK